ncbi:hypothetical protein HD806DRAFT_512866 [Xylariaceae sp. AK1471]|nr:hypothetical protein HD806DRAFT_512866 [Xylariaceae sp. AK1471]
MSGVLRLQRVVIRCLSDLFSRKSHEVRPAMLARSCRSFPRLLVYTGLGVVGGVLLELLMHGMHGKTSCRRTRNPKMVHNDVGKARLIVACDLNETSGDDCKALGCIGGCEIFSVACMLMDSPLRVHKETPSSCYGGLLYLTSLNLVNLSCKYSTKTLAKYSTFLCISPTHYRWKQLLVARANK